MTDDEVAEMWRFSTPPDREFWTGLDRSRTALERIADPDTWILDQGLGGGFAE